MAMVIQEFAGEDFRTSIVEHDNDINSFNVNEAAGDLSIDPNSLMVDIEGIHAYPHATRNFTRYMPKCLKNSVPSWTKPYNRPLIKHHNEKNGEIIGRVLSVEYKTKDTFSGTPALQFTVNVPNETAKQDIRNGTESTVSIGVIAHDVRCSICGQQLAGGEMCEHERGVAYDGETCYWDIHSMEAKELSYVIVPSDIYAKNKKIYTVTKSGEKPQIRESLDAEKKEGVKKQMATTKEATEVQLEEANAKITELEAKVSELTESLQNAETKVTELTESSTELEGKVAELEGKAKELEESKASLEAEIKESAEMREGLEKALEEAKVAKKEALVETVQALRKATGKKELNDEVAKNRSESSLEDAIMDLKEELADTKEITGKAATPAAGSVVSPGLAEGEEESKGSKDITEGAEEEKIDLKAGLQTLFNDIVSYHK